MLRLRSLAALDRPTLTFAVACSILDRQVEAATIQNGRFTALLLAAFALLAACAPRRCYPLSHLPGRHRDDRGCYSAGSANVHPPGALHADTQANSHSTRHSNSGNSRERGRRRHAERCHLGSN